MDKGVGYIYIISLWYETFCSSSNKAKTYPIVSQRASLSVAGQYAVCLALPTLFCIVA